MLMLRRQRRYAFAAATMLAGATFRCFSPLSIFRWLTLALPRLLRLRFRHVCSAPPPRWMMLALITWQAYRFRCPRRDDAAMIMRYHQRYHVTDAFHYVHIRCSIPLIRPGVSLFETLAPKHI